MITEHKTTHSYPAPRLRVVLWHVIYLRMCHYKIVLIAAKGLFIFAINSLLT